MGKLKTFKSLVYIDLPRDEEDEEAFVRVAQNNAPSPRGRAYRAMPKALVAASSRLAELIFSSPLDIIFTFSSPVITRSR